MLGGPCQSRAGSLLLTFSSQMMKNRRNGDGPGGGAGPMSCPCPLSHMTVIVVRGEWEGLVFHLNQSHLS